MPRTLLQLVVVSFLDLCLLCEAFSGDEVQQQSLSLRLNKHDVQIGEQVILREFVPVAAAVSLRSLSHNMDRIGFYHSGLKQMVDLDDYHGVDLTVLDGLPDGFVGSGVLAFDFKRDGYKGYEFRFRPKRAGTYVLQATWRLDGGKGQIKSKMVRLTVRPIEKSNQIILDIEDPKAAAQEQVEMEKWYDLLQEEWKDKDQE
jgi:hypothetical protein